MNTQTIRMIQQSIQVVLEADLPSPSDFGGTYETFFSDSLIPDIAEDYACDVTAPFEEDDDADEIFDEAKDEAVGLLNLYVAAGASDTGLRFDEWWCRENGWVMKVA